MLSYGACTDASLRLSDHRPVAAAFRVQLELRSPDEDTPQSSPPLESSPRSYLLPSVGASWLSSSELRPAVDVPLKPFVGSRHVSGTESD